jgi:hypothetical protein
MTVRRRGVIRRGKSRWFVQGSRGIYMRRVVLRAMSWMLMEVG